MFLRTLCVFVMTVTLFSFLNNHGHSEESDRITTTPDYTAQAWHALLEGDHEEVVRQATLCLEDLGEVATRQQRAGKEISNVNAENFPELNSVGTCLFILARSWEKKGNHKEATDAYKRLIKDYEDARCKNQEGYFWRPAVAAQKRLAELKPE